MLIQSLKQHKQIYRAEVPAAEDNLSLLYL